MAGNELDRLRRFFAPDVVIGKGARMLVGEYATALGFSKPLLVTDAVLSKLRWVDDVIAKLESSGLAPSCFDSIHPNPRSAEVMNGAEVFLSSECDSIVAIGGGSVIDVAKGIGIVVSNGGHILDYEGIDRIAKPIPPLICIPTTAGSAADVSQFAIINDEQRKVKIAIVSKTIVPDLSLIDPETLTTLDSYSIACTGMDALSHAVEAYVSTASSEITDLHALHAVGLVAGNLFEAVRSQENMAVLSNMASACLSAGLAFSNTSLGCVHAIAHSLGGYLDLPHGECNALLLPEVIRYNYMACPGKFDEIWRRMGVPIDQIDLRDRCDALVSEVNNLADSCGIRGRLGKRGVHRSDIGKIAANAILDPCNATNPRVPTVQDLTTILELSI